MILLQNFVVIKNINKNLTTQFEIINARECLSSPRWEISFCRKYEKTAENALISIVLRAHLTA